MFSMVLQLLRSHGFKMGKIEAQTVGIDQGALLGDMVAQHFAQCRMQQVRRRMVERRGLAPSLINPGFHLLTGLQRAHG